MMPAMVDAKARIVALGADLAQAPDEWRSLLDTLSVALLSGTGVRAVTYSLILLLIGGSVEWLYWTYAYGPLRVIQATPAASPRQALRLGLRRLVMLGSGALLFAGATMAASAVFSWPNGVHEMVVAVTLILLVLRLAWVLVVVVLAPGRSSLRLVPVPRQRVRWVAFTVMLVAFLLASARFGSELLEQAGTAPHSAQACGQRCTSKGWSSKSRLLTEVYGGIA